MTPHASSGRLIAVVGPSGVGKDSIMAAVVAADPTFKLVRRVITRAPGLGGEEYDAISVEAFKDAAKRGEFAVHWGAHGLFYGIPRTVLDDIKAGTACFANLSRSALSDAAAMFKSMTVLHLTASPEILASRLAARGRESDEEIAKRLAQADKPLPDGLDIITINNDGALVDTVQAVLAALQPVRA